MRGAGRVGTTVVIIVLFGVSSVLAFLLYQNQEPPRELTVPFWGPHQAGIDTPQQGFVFLVAYDVVKKDRSALRDLFRAWTVASQRLTNGMDLGDLDTGEVLGYLPSRMTVTVGLGPSFFDRRIPLNHSRPAGLEFLAVLPSDKLRPEFSNGDVVVQLCGDDFASLYGAYHNLSRLAAGVLHVKWLQTGFRSSAEVSQRPDGRNLQGFHDGTVNVDSADTTQMATHVWIESSPDRWTIGGTYLVVRRIRLLVESWDNISVLDKERIVGRTRLEGTLTESPSAESHVKLAHGQGAESIFRRAFSYFNGYHSAERVNDAGLLFLSFQQDVSKQLLPILRRLASADPLNQYTETVGSAVFFVLPGVEPGHYLAEDLLEDREQTEEGQG